MKTPPIVLLLVMLMAASCDRKPAVESGADLDRTAHSSIASPHITDSDALLREKGKAVVQEAFSLLSSNLLAALAAGGASNAIPFCSVQALPLTETVAQNYQVQVRRVSHRVRNPKNAPTAEEARALAAFQSQTAAGRTPEPIVQRHDTEAFFYAPIVINNPLCLTCHGEPGRDIAPETAALLSKLHPDDQATGFRMNDLRGMWVVRIQSNSPNP